jgi:hypothetical protein
VEKKMARKRQQNAPRVPRTHIVREAAAPARPRDRQSAPVTAPAHPPAKEYAHVKRDLLRIALFGTLIFGGMGILKLIGL